MNANDESVPGGDRPTDPTAAGASGSDRTSGGSDASERLNRTDALDHSGPTTPGKICGTEGTPNAEQTRIEQPSDPTAFQQTLSMVQAAIPNCDLNQTLPETSLRPRREKADEVTKSSQWRPRLVSSDSGTTDGARADSSEAAPDYVTLRLLGQGGMGTVHLARQIALGRDVAIKQIQSKHRQQQGLHEEFLTEAVLTGKLEHPNIVPIYEVGRTDVGDLFYSMKNIKGRAWDESIGSLSVIENLDILLNVGDAVAFAHSEGVVHRDLKPQNIMIGGFGEVLVLDWGLAVLMDVSGSVKAQPGGTPAYMAPEMMTPPFVVSPRSDIYLLGAILFRILTGRPPHQGDNANQCLQAVMRNQIVEPDPPLLKERDRSGELLSIAMRAMATSPDDRFTTVLELQQAIRGFLAHRDSLEIAGHAQAALTQAGNGGSYTDYSRAVFGFEEALNLWEGNRIAQLGAAAARLAWARAAESQNDFDLALSLLNDSSVEQQEIRSRVTAARDERDARLQRIRRLRRISLAASLTVAVVAGVAAVWISHERSLAIEAKIAADEQRQAAVLAREAAVNAREVAVDARKAEQTQRAIAEQNFEIARRNELTAQANAERADRAATAALASAEEARRNQTLAERQTYISDMRLAQMNWETSNAGAVRELLDRHHDDKDFKGFEWYYWQRLSHRELATFTGHTAHIWSLAVDPSGKRAASGGEDQMIRIWNLETGQELQTLQGNNGTALTLDWSPDGTLLASGTGSKVQVWDVSTGELRLEKAAFSHNVQSVKFSPDGRSILAAGDNHNYDNMNAEVTACVFVWDAATGEDKLALDVQRPYISKAAVFSHDGKQIAFLNTHRAVDLVDATTGELLRRISAKYPSVIAIALSPDGNWLALCATNNTVELWNLQTGDLIHTLTGHTHTIEAAVFSADSSRLVTCSWDRTIKLWNTADGTEHQTLRGHADRVRRVVLTADSHRIVSVSNDLTGRVWSVATPVEAVEMDLKRGIVKCIAFSPDNQRVACTTAQGITTVRDVATGTEPLTLTGEWTTSYNDFAKLIVNSVAFSPDGRWIVSGHSDQLIRVWDAQTGELVRTLAGHTGSVTQVVFGPDSHWVASASTDNSIRLWEITQGTVIRTLPGHTAFVTGLDCSDDGALLVTCSADGTARLWDVHTGETNHVIKDRNPKACAAAITPDGRFVATSGPDFGIQIHDAATGQLAQTLNGHTSRIWDTQFSPDGRRLLSASEDGTIKLWDLEVGSQTLSFVDTEAFVSVTISPDGRHIAGATMRGKVRIWSVSRPDWQEDAASAVEVLQVPPVGTDAVALPQSDPTQ